ncbi:MAG: hypothetical protein N2318_07110 [Meiothermus sp.]|nr:hypothetical protein [Meiothermus sp.]
MKSYLADEFFEHYRKLPENVRKQARAAFKLWQDNPFHRSLNFKEVHAAEGIWSARVGRNYRVLGLRDAEEITWFWIGSHSDYDNLLEQL